MVLKSTKRMIQSERRRFELAVGGISPPIFMFDPALVTFTPAMTIRAGQGPFDGAPIIQGMFDGSGVPDGLNLVRGDQIHNNFYANFDTYQGTIGFWWTPEKDRDVGQTDDEFFFDVDSTPEWSLKYEHDNAVVRLTMGGTSVTSSLTIVAGTTYFILARWDLKNTLDGTNYLCVSVNDVHSFGGASSPSAVTPDVSLWIGSFGGTTRPVNGIIEGITVYRRVLYDGTYGVCATFDDSGPVDEMLAIYAAGAGADPCLITGGSFDIPFCLPTNSDAGTELVTGDGNAWSHPHSSGVLEHQWFEDGGYLGRPYAVLFNGTSSIIDCGSGATLDDVPSGAGQATIEAWCRPDDVSADFRVLAHKGDWNNRGWVVYYASGLIAIRGQWAGGLKSISSDISEFEGKWLHFVGYIDDTAKTVRIAINGIWDPVSTASAGAYVSEAADNFEIGAIGGIREWLGAIGWVAYSNNDRYTAGTDFVPPRQPPAPDGNHIEMWHLDEGTGATATAEVTSPANDGTISNGTWEAQWDQEGSPLVPYSIEFDGSITSLDATSGANIDDLPGGASGFTAEGWFRHDSEGESNTGTFWDKTSWYMRFSAAGTIRVFIDYDTADIDETFSWTPDGKQHHWMLTYNENGVDRFARIYLDGILVYTTAASVGNYVTEAAQNCYIGNNSAGTATMNGGLGWQTLSDNVRASATFVPSDRITARANDANMHLRYAMRDGAGTSVADTSGNAYTGTITFGTGQWQITPDMEIDAPGHRVFNWGYVIGNDAGDEGITQIYEGLTPGTDYVLRAVLHTGPDGRGTPKIVIHDETNANDITELIGPFLVGLHDGANNSATLIDSTTRWPQMLVGWTIYNITDGSSATITAIDGTGTIVTGALAGGTDNDWDTGDEYRFVPPNGPSEMDDYPWIETFCFELPTIDRDFTISADCVDISVKVVNNDAEGTIYIQQLELLENLLDNPSLEVQQQIDMNSYTLNTGVLASGNLASTVVRDGSYMEIQEVVGVPGYDIEFTFPVDGLGTFFSIWGRYQGNIGHNVNVDAWNNGGGVWDNIGTITHAVADALWTYPLLAAHTNAGVVTVRFQHTSPGNINDRLWIDKAFGYQDPWIPDGWVNVGLDTGDSVAEVTIVHSGAQSIEYAATATTSEGIYGTQTVSGGGVFVCFGLWSYQGGRLRSSSSNRMAYHNTLSDYIFTLPVDVMWFYTSRVFRAISAGIRPAYFGKGGVAYGDDLHAFELDSVSLTATPASEANSLESGGLRIDGFDRSTQPIPAGMLGATSGHIMWRMRSRHDRDFAAGSANPRVMRAWLNLNNYIEVYIFGEANTFFRIVVAGVNTVGNVLIAYTPDTEYLLEIIYTAAQAEFIIDGVTQITAVPGAGIDFGANIPNIMYWGSDDTGVRQIDAVFKAP